MCRTFCKSHHLIDWCILRCRECCDDCGQIDACHDADLGIIKEVVRDIGRRSAQQVCKNQNTVVALKSVDQFCRMRNACLDVQIRRHIKTSDAIAVRIFSRAVYVLTAAFKSGGERCVSDDAYPDHEDSLQQLNAGSLALRINGQAPAFRSEKQDLLINQLP